MRESTFTTEVIRSIRRDGGWVYKIPDAPTSRITGMRFTASKPFDLVACMDGRLVAIECKQIKKWKAFGMNDMRTSQLVNLPSVIKAGGRSFVFLNVRIARKENRLIFLDWEVWGPRIERESIKAKDLKELPFCEAHTHEGKTHFDLSDFYEWLVSF